MAFILINDDFFSRADSGRWSQFALTGRDSKSMCANNCEARLFIEEARVKGSARLLAEPRLIALNGRPATFLSGGQAAILNGESGGVQATIIPTASSDGHFARLEMKLVRFGEGERGEGRQTSSNMAVPFGQTLVHRTQGKDGQHFYVLTTPYLIETSSVGFCQQMAAPAPVAVAPVTMATPAAMVRQVAAVAQPCCSPGELQLVQLMIEYHEACAAGDRAAARNLAARCVALDPMCFAR
jgi:hypothetical protein